MQLCLRHQVKFVDTAIKYVKRVSIITISTFVNSPNFNAAEEKTIHVINR